MRPKILTVDDSKTIRLIVAKAFKPFDCDVFEAANGIEGLSVAAHERPDVIILDLTMPLMDGAEMLAKMKSNAELKTIPVIMLTAEAGRDTVLRIARLGVRDYLIKPFKEDALVDRVGRVIELRLKGAAIQVKRFDDPLNILVIDDKPAIIEQIRAAFSETPWLVQARGTVAEALEFCGTTTPDAALVSLSLPEGGGFAAFQQLRASPRMKHLPIFALSVKTAAEEQARAQQGGFTGIVTKPIDADDLKSKISRTLNLDTSYKYFEMRDGVLALRLPAQCTPYVANEVTVHLRNKVSDAVDSGVDKMIVDMSQVRKADMSVIKLGLSVWQLCEEMSLKQRMIGSPAVMLECRNYEETKDWNFESSFEEALAVLNGGALAPA